MENEILSEIINNILSDLESCNKSEKEIYEILQSKLAFNKEEYDKEWKEKKSSSTGLSKFFNVIGTFNVNLFDFLGFLLLNKDIVLNMDKEKLKILATCISKLQEKNTVENGQLNDNVENEKIRMLTEMNKKVSDENLHLNSLLAKQEDDLYLLLQEIFGFIGETPKSEEMRLFLESIKDIFKRWSKKIEILWTVDKEVEEDYFEIRKTKMKIERAVKLPCICVNGKVALLGLKYIEV